MADFTYHQATGDMYFGSAKIGTGHSGRDQGRNNPAMEGVHDVGPLPRNEYEIAAESSHVILGIVAMRLTPVGTGEMYGRAGFFIHAPELSEGCIVLDLNTRCTVAEAVRKGKDRLLVV